MTEVFGIAPSLGGPRVKERSELWRGVLPGLGVLFGARFGAPGSMSWFPDAQGGSF